MIYVFEGFEEDKRVLVEKMDNEITITTKTNSNVECIIKKADDIEWTVCKSQKEAIRWLEENK